MLLLVVVYDGRETLSPGTMACYVEVWFFSEQQTVEERCDMHVVWGVMSEYICKTHVAPEGISLYTLHNIYI